MQNIKEKINNVTLNLYIKARAGAQKIHDKLHENKGSFFTDHGLAIVIIVVIAAIFLTAIVALFKDRIFHNLRTRPMNSLQ